MMGIKNSSPFKRRVAYAVIERVIGKQKLSMGREVIYVFIRRSKEKWWEYAWMWGRGQAERDITTPERK